jgi:YesN/AraC family two-component response regulator
MDLLIDGNNSIGDVANQLNYSSSQYYSKMFKKFIGISPRGFLEKYSEETNGIKGAFFR